MKEEMTMPMIPPYKTKQLYKIYGSSNEFLDSWNGCELKEVMDNQGFELSDDFIRMTYNVLLAKHYSDPIAFDSVDLFKMRVNQIIYQYGPACEKKIQIHKSVLALTEDEIFEGSKVINNHAYNPSTDPSTQSLEELEYTDSQDVQKTRRSKLEGYSNLVRLIETDVVSEFLDRFKNLFKTFLIPDVDRIYCDEDDEDED